MSGRVDVQPGMEVVDMGYQHVGEVAEVRHTTFLLHRSVHRDVYVPLEAVREVAGNQIVLYIEADQIDHMNWSSPPNH